ncbi:hydroxyectoine utilization dehydratase EutB [Virgibacillus profundi]|uniref:threonine ammonia-lyase n=1 Tax=Virgibacillus profundi TaxID=2024555 RepID=A0A2A2IIC3_9BACI|nr:hydroxyectoine utilization dehydratase EutB [Virgibacillus profundi]PAV30855.1 hydroxyectoine utilization dehydratase EutB [Virgibacillus profundi]PXY55038.1 hydroxyectoine utilization dehydratase EutB [Virgibacillus profundi]
MSANPVTLRDIWKAKKRISSVVQKSPFIYSPVLSEITGSSVHLKLENLNVSGSFKIRGATNKILSLTSEEKQRGVTTFSTGNFGMSVAYISRKLGINATICISKRVPKAKMEALHKSGAKIEIHGNSQDEAEQRSYELEREQGLSVIHPFDDAYIIAGQGTIGLEILEDFPEVDTVIGGLSGGGLLSGIGVALKSIDPEIRVLGVSPIHGAAMYESIQSGKPVIVEEKDTLADSLLGGIGMNNQYTFDMVQQYVDEVTLLEEEDIAKGMAFMLDKHRMVIEGAAASGIGAILNGKVQLGSHVVVVISGCSVDTSVLLDVANQHADTVWMKN